MNNLATFICSFAPNKMNMSYYVMNDKKYITADMAINIYNHINDMIDVINKQIKEERHMIELLKSARTIVEEDRDYLTFDDSINQIINHKLQIENIYLYDGLEEYLHDYYNIHACKELKNYENNTEEFFKKRTINANFKFTSELKHTAKMFRLRYKNNQHYM